MVPRPNFYEHFKTIYDCSASSSFGSMFVKTCVSTGYSIFPYVDFTFALIDTTV